MPIRSTIHVDQLLSNISVKYVAQDLVAMQVFPEVPVKKDSDRYRIYTRNFRIPQTLRANRGLAREGDFEVTTSTYVLEQHALKGYISDNDAANYDISDLRADMTEDLTEKILLRLELSLANHMTTTSWSLGVSLTAAQAFDSNSTASNPLPIFDTAATTIINNGGFKPNYAVIPRNPYVAIKNHVSVLDRTKYVSKDMTPEILSGLFDLKNIYVPAAAQDTAAEGIASTIASIWGPHVLVGYKPDSPGPMKPSSGYIFRANYPMVRRWRVEERQAEAIEVQMQYNVKVVASLSGYLIKGASA